MEATNLAGLYQLPLLDWAHIEDGLGTELTQAPDTGGPNRHTYWLATINADGSPHVNGIGALWADGCFWFQTGPDTHKHEAIQVATPRIASYGTSPAGVFRRG